MLCTGWSVFRLNSLCTKIDVTYVTFCLYLKEKQVITANATMKVLNVAEKNDAAKNISLHLSKGNSSRREGLSKFNKIYEFNLQLWNQNCKMIMTSVSGHLLGYEFVGSYRRWEGCHPLSLFDALVVKQCIQNYADIKKTLEREVRNCQALVLWTDCDREGENIGFEIIQVCRAIKPGIKIYRAKFSEITQCSMERAIRNLEQPNKAISDAVDVRSELDLRIGAAFTRFQTLRLQKVFPRTLSDMLISYGSCQFPTLGFVVERFLAIERFKPEPYWRLKVTDMRNDILVEFRWDRNRLFEELPCQILLDRCLENPNATVEKVTSKPKSKWRPLPLDTIELEKQGSRKLQLNAKETMQIAERLYTQGLISYPRTETNIFPKELNLVPLVSDQTNNPVWGDFARRLLADGPTPRQGKKSDQAHPPIHPTKYSDTLQGHEARVYEFVTRHFLACLSKNAEGEETLVEIDIAAEKFAANGLRIIAKNYLEVYVYEKWSDKVIPVYERGQVFGPTGIEMVRSETTPPNLLTEADLIALMDKHGIGTDATHAEHIETIKSRQYVGLADGSHFVPGNLGIGLVTGYDRMGFQMSKPNLRAELESDLKLICEGKKDPQVVLLNQISKYREVFKIALERANLIDGAIAEYIEERPKDAEELPATVPPEDIVVFSCPKCGSNMVLKDRSLDGRKYIGCMAYPDCSNSIWLPSTIERVQVLDRVCQQCPGNLPILRFKLKRGALPLFGIEHETCIGGCDEEFNQVMEIRVDNVRRVQGTNDTGYTSFHRSSVRSSDTSQRNNTPSGRTDSIPGTHQRQNFPPPRPSAPSVLPRGKGGAKSNDNWDNPSTSVHQQRPSFISRNPSASNDGNGGSGSSQISGTSRSNYGNDSDTGDRIWGTNDGKQFYKCAKPQGQGCDFFMWDPNNMENEGEGANSREASSNGRQNRGNWINAMISNDPAVTAPNVINCLCGLPAKQLTVRKEGPNKGRQFYKCQQDICKFFDWGNEAGSEFPEGQIRAPSARGRGRGRGRDGDGNIGGKRKCGICGVEGHTRRTCPQKTMD
ncbi:DNA topoisomerase 3-alpha isoform X2 [Orussus abietinus]|uniref:DNA topoisomerase 3-alpha isoform X2 n=1 Tax=Orussus abietinus TaxID=222816 RepID=UPI000625C8F7|nr:DNA topoisomerase 3-alpha isoform X2 [Orussus abietinus]